jgi:hypothetical protein
VGVRGVVHPAVRVLAALGPRTADDLAAAVSRRPDRNAIAGDQLRASSTGHWPFTPTRTGGGVRPVTERPDLAGGPRRRPGGVGEGSRAALWIAAPWIAALWIAEHLADAGEDEAQGDGSRIGCADTALGQRPGAADPGYQGGRRVDSGDGYLRRSGPGQGQRHALADFRYQFVDEREQRPRGGSDEAGDPAPWVDALLVRVRTRTAQAGGTASSNAPVSASRWVVSWPSNSALSTARVPAPRTACSRSVRG